jgi:hypothetical protein
MGANRDRRVAVLAPRGAALGRALVATRRAPHAPAGNACIREPASGRAVPPSRPPWTRTDRVETPGPEPKQTLGSPPKGSAGTIASDTSEMDEPRASVPSSAHYRFRLLAFVPQATVARGLVELPARLSRLVREQASRGRTPDARIERKRHSWPRRWTRRLLTPGSCHQAACRRPSWSAPGCLESRATRGTRAHALSRIGEERLAGRAYDAST